MEEPPTHSEGDASEDLARASRFIDTAGDIQIDPATLPGNRGLLGKLDEQIAAAQGISDYELLVREQSGASKVLERTGALQELKTAVLIYCAAEGPAPPYQPQAIKALLRERGWLPEVRVPPYDARHDDLPINERYDLYKVFEDGGEKLGVAIEIERWEVWTDLLKFRRGIHRGQIAAGIVLHDNPYSLTYVYDHLRLLSEPLFGDLAILFAAPAGPGLGEAWAPSTKHYGPYLMPNP